jgi:hypothetical protein
MRLFISLVNCSEIPLIILKTLVILYIPTAQASEGPVDKTATFLYGSGKITLLQVSLSSRAYGEF